MKTFKTKAGTELPILILKGKDYLQVAHRIVWFREEHPDWEINTDIVFHDEKRSVVRASICTPERRVIAQASKTENTAGFGDHLEKAETGAIGRALALCGYGTQFTTDLDEGERLADSPLVNAPQSGNVRPIIQYVPPSQVEALRLATKEELGLTENDLKEVLKAFGATGWDAIPVRDLAAIKETLKRKASK